MNEKKAMSGKAEPGVKLDIEIRFDSVQRLLEFQQVIRDRNFEHKMFIHFLDLLYAALGD